MEIGTRQIGQSPQRNGHPVFIGTIGGIRAIVHGATAIWKVGNMGVPQLKRMLSYVVTRVDHAIHRDDIAAIGSKRWPELARSTNLPSALTRLFRNWGMAPALHQNDDYLTLMRHECWISDTDLIEHYATAAAAHLAVGNSDSALASLHQAVTYCGGPYLPDYDVPDYSLSDEQQHWRHYQRDILHQLARLHIDRAAYQDALRVARKTSHLGDEESADDALLADIYKSLGNLRLARYYRAKADAAR